MPIKPEISLGVTQAPQVDPFTGIERGMKLQQLAMQPAILEQQLATAKQAEQTSRAAQMTSEAQLPGVTATAAALKREKQDFPAWLAKNGGQYINPKTGNMDNDRMTAAAMRDGFANEGLAYAGLELGRIKQKLDNAKTEQDTASARMELKNKAMTQIGNYTANIKDKSKVLPAINDLTDAIEKQIPGLGTELRNMFVEEDRNKGITTVNHDAILAARTSMMTPEQQDANTRAWALLDPKFAAEQRNVLQGDQRMDAMRQAREGEAVINGNMAGIDHIPTVIKQYNLPGKPGLIVASAWQEIVGKSPEAAALQNTIDLYNSRLPKGAKPISIPTEGFEGIKARLSQENSILTPQIKELRTQSETGMVTPPTQQRQATATAALPKAQPIPRPANIEEIMALSPGTRFIDPRDGKTMRTR